MEWPPADLLGYMTHLRGLIADDEKRISKYKVALETKYPDIWKVVAAALAARVSYYRGEVARARQDTVRFTLGEDPSPPSPWGNLLCGWVTTWLNEVAPGIRALNTSWRDLRVGNEEIAAMIYGLDQSLLEITIQQLTKVTDDLERTIYG